MEKICMIIVCIVISFTQGAPIQDTISNFIQFRNHFLRADVDDDGFIEYGDIRHIALRADIDRDGKISEEEISKDPVLEKISIENLHIYDSDGDGFLTLSEITRMFYLQHGAFGDNRNLAETLEIFAGKEQGTATGEEISVKSFVILERNFNLIDIDDDDLVSKEEYQSEYRVADFNQDNILTDLEVKLFRPTVLISIDDYCSDISAGCSLDDFLPLFNEADQNGDGVLDLKEYATGFGREIETE